MQRPILVTGSYGQLGRAVLAAAEIRGLEAEGRDLDTLDITSRQAVDEWIVAARPRLVVNCAAFTAVDDCETAEGSARAVNADAVAHLSAACNVVGATLVHISTDYVFDGAGSRPYREDDPVAPTSAYGRTKLLGEQAARSAHRHLVIRTAWLYGRGGRHFVGAIRRQLEDGATRLRVVADQIGSPTYCDDLAEALLDLVEVGASGVVHVVNDGTTSWHGFASEIVRLLGADAEVIPVTTAEFPRPARRPAYSVLDTARLTTLIGRRLPPWGDALARYLEASCEP
ncbi:MAG: dTDP-4-dehydrorhamnose reductase [Thermoanaerobaculales bacterium]|jgi:dTDP-4-dehydrorhamnose reductase|nr:dTDP-4-dehydrorhamnose reductase [Thermoanaerobaculales bacterium]